MTRTLRRGALPLLVMMLALVGVPLAGIAGAAPYDAKTVIAEGHVDLFYVGQAGGAAVVQVKDDATVSPPQLRSPEDVVVHVRPSVDGRTANAFIAEIPGFTNVGDTVYVLPQTNLAGRVFAGFGHSLPLGSNVTYTITGYEGPGNYATWQAGDEGPIVFLNSTVAGSNFSSFANHEHFASGFTALGEYKVTIGVSATLPDSSVITAAPAVYTFYVGETLPTDPGPGPDPDPDPEPGDTALSIDGLAAHYHTGEIATLQAVQTPATGEDHYHWFTRAPGETEWTVVPGALTGRYGFVVRGADDGTEVIVRLYDHDHSQIAESAPVTIEVDDHGNPPVEGAVISTTLQETAGSLVISVDEGAREVTLSDLTLNGGADRLVANGEAVGIRVTDTRAGNVGWNASGRVRAFTSVDGDSFGGDNLGWAPKVISSSAGQTVTAGDPVAPALSGGPGVGAYRTLGSAPAGAGVGAAVLGADLTIEVPPTLTPGTYQGLMLLTVI